MYRRLAIVALLLGAGSGAAQERLLPAQSQVYLRCDGLKPHETDYRATAAGKLLQGELGTFLHALGKYGVELARHVAEQNQPEAGPWIDDAVNVAQLLYQRGLVLGIELRQVHPAAAHGIVVLPGGVEAGVLPLIQKLVDAAKADVKDVKIGRRFVHQAMGAPVKVGWWAEGADVVLYVGTEEPAAYARDIDSGKTGLDPHPLYRKLRDFKAFPTAARGYIDLGAIARVAGDVAPALAQLVDELGLSGQNHVTFVAGFDGLFQRSVIELEAPGPRKGLLSLGTRQTLRLKDLPPLPADATSIRAGTMDAGRSYDTVLKLAFAGTKIFAPAYEDTVKEALKTVEALLGVDLKREVFDNLGSLYVTYGAPSEGLLGLGTASALQVKDGKKLVEALERMSKAAGLVPGLELTWNKRDYRGGQMFDLYLRFNETSNFVLGFGLYRDWLLVAPFPQAIKGFILRSNGTLPAWQPDAKLTKLLALFPDSYTGIKISDPRPTIEALLVAAPVVLNLANSVIVHGLPGMRPFDLALIPHAKEATLGLFPGVTVTTDDGRVVRYESRRSFP